MSVQGSLLIDLAGIQLHLLPQRAVWRPDTQTVFVADVHIGKAATFRRLGVPVPDGTTGDTLQRLQTLLGATQAAHLVVLGDLFHSEHIRGTDSLQAFEQWRAARADVRITLVRGNHDARSGDPSPHLGIECVDAPAAFDGLHGLHEPDASFTHAALAGHVHPAVRLSGKGRDAVRVSCFVQQGRQLTLPAFGAFTGAHTLRDLSGLTVYPLTSSTVFKLPASA
jgi:DNA ligase-associated metallophosphoesterase